MVLKATLALALAVPIASISGCTLLLDSSAPRFADTADGGLPLGDGAVEAGADEAGTMTDAEDAAPHDAGEDAASPAACTSHEQCRAAAPDCYASACDMASGRCELSVAPDCTACGDGPTFTCVHGRCRERGIIYATGFEDGEFELSGMWWTSPMRPWVQSFDDRHGGQSSVRSGRLDDDAGSELRLSLSNVPERARLRLWLTMSSETDDFFRIEIQGAFVQQWSGEHEWLEFEAPVHATGEVDFTFRYEKDELGTAGEDLVRIDDLEIYKDCSQGTNATSSMQ